MKTNTLIPILVILGVAILFFFPSPEENFVWYFLTFLLFIGIIIFLGIKSKKKR